MPSIFKKRKLSMPHFNTLAEMRAARAVPQPQDGKRLKTVVTTTTTTHPDGTETTVKTIVKEEVMENTDTGLVKEIHRPCTIRVERDNTYCSPPPFILLS